MIAISKELLNTQIDVAQRLLKKWQDKLAQGIPGIDLPADDFTSEQFTREMVAEFLVVAGMFETLATVINEGNG